MDLLFSVRDRLKQLALWPVLISNFVAIVGLLWLGWKVADLFFWFWYELALTGATLVLLATVWSFTGTPADRSQVKNKPLPALGACALILLYATMFFGMAYVGEWERWARFPEFLQGKILGLLGTLGVHVLYLARTLRQPLRGMAEAGNIDRQFARRSFVIVALYAVLMLHYHFSGARQLSITPAYLKSMGLLLLVFKLTAELGGFDRLFHRRRAAARKDA